MIHEEYATNITKEELAELPLEEFEGRIFVVLTEKEADKAVDYLMKFKKSKVRTALADLRRPVLLNMLCLKASFIAIVARRR